MSLRIVIIFGVATQKYNQSILLKSCGHTCSWYFVTFRPFFLIIRKSVVEILTTNCPLCIIIKKKKSTTHFIIMRIGKILPVKIVHTDTKINTYTGTYYTLKRLWFTSQEIIQLMKYWGQNILLAFMTYVIQYIL